MDTEKFIEFAVAQKGDVIIMRVPPHKYEDYMYGAHLVSKELTEKHGISILIIEDTIDLEIVRKDEE